MYPHTLAWIPMHHACAPALSNKSINRSRYREADLIIQLEHRRTAAIYTAAPPRHTHTALTWTYIHKDAPRRQHMPPHYANSLIYGTTNLSEHNRPYLPGRNIAVCVVRRRLLVTLAHAPFRTPRTHHQSSRNGTHTRRTALASVSRVCVCVWSFSHSCCGSGVGGACEIATAHTHTGFRQQIEEARPFNKNYIKCAHRWMLSAPTLFNDKLASGIVCY